MIVTTKLFAAADRMKPELVLRRVVPDDLAIFFGHQADPEANYMAAFAAKDPTDWDAFTARWNRILADGTVVARTIVFDGSVAGNVLSYEEAGRPEITYWIGREHWNKGIATRALSCFLERENEVCPMFARVAKDNHASRRVLEKCGFTIVGEARGFANARDEEIEELVLRLGADGG